MNNSYAQKLLLIFTFLSITAGFGLAAYYLNKYQNPELDLQALLVNKDNQILKAFFSPDNNPKDILISLIKSEKKQISIAIYTLTEKDITQALIDACKRGVKIEVVADRCYASDKASKVYLLANNKIPIWIYQTTNDDRNASLMHNKFCIFEDNILNKKIVWTGSYNFTRRASLTNQENILVLDSKEIVDSFSKQFDILKNRSLIISGDLETIKTTKKPIEKPAWYETCIAWFGFVK